MVARQPSSSQRFSIRVLLGLGAVGTLGLVAFQAAALGWVATVGIFVCGVALPIVAVIALSSRTSRRNSNIKALAGRLNGAQPNLSVRLPSSADSAGEVNEFLGRLEDVMVRLHLRVSRNQGISLQLNESAREMADSVGQVTGRVKRLRHELGSLDMDIAGASSSLEEIMANVASLAHQIEAQDRLASRSAASVQQILASVGSVSASLQEKQNSVQNLLNLSHEGGEKVRQTNKVIGKVAENAESIMQMADIISDIADRTNLLAMNASIEAAHAGSAGRGFAVVAEEIRKLATTTGAQAQKITGSLKETDTQILQAQADGLSTQEAFGRLEQEMSGFAETMTVLGQTMRELHDGGNEVGAVTEDFVQTSQTIRAASQEMSYGAKEILTAIHHVRDVSNESLKQVGEIDELAGDLNRGALKVSAFGNQNRYNNSILTSDLNGFHPYKAEVRKANDLGIEWDDFLSVGIAAMDDQHQELFRRINALLVDLIGPHEGAHAKELVAAIRDFAVKHFHDEEELMSCHGCPLQTEHCQVHSTFVQEFLDFEKRLDTEGWNAAVLIQLQDRVVNWLLDHIGGADQKYGAYINEKKVG